MYKSFSLLEGQERTRVAAIWGVKYARYMNKWLLSYLQHYLTFLLLNQVLICGNFKGMKIKPGSMGKPSPAFDVKVCTYPPWRTFHSPVCFPTTLKHSPCFRDKSTLFWLLLSFHAKMEMTLKCYLIFQILILYHTILNFINMNTVSS